MTGQQGTFSRASRFLRSAVLPTWWILFALLTLRAGNEPGFVMHPEQMPYPWRGVISVWLVLAAEMVALYLIVRPSGEHPWRRLGMAIVMFGALSLMSLLTFVTDMPGYHYIPGNFHLFTFVALIGLAAIRDVIRRGSRSTA